MSRILIISTSREMAPQPTVPIGAAWVAEALSLAGFEVRLLDLCFERDPLMRINALLESFRPDGIGFSIRNLDNCDFLSPVSFLPEIRKITDFVKSRSQARILLGGAGVSVMPEEVLDYLGLDHAVVGEGEQAALEFFGRGDSEASLPPRLCRAAGPAISVMPRLHRWVDAAQYLKLEPVLPVQGKRGCANRCLYCTYNRIEGSGWRLREPEAVVEEMAIAQRETGGREFEFVDSVFNEPEGYLETLMEEILRRRLQARFRVASLSPKGLTADQLRLMERAGMDSVVITPESASGVTLASLGKSFDEGDVHHAAELIAASKLRVLWCFLLGAPAEDEASLSRTIDFINRRIRKKDAAFITTGIRVYPGTGVHAIAVKEGVVDPSHSLLMPTFYFSPLITPQKALEALQKGVEDLSRCIFVSDTRPHSLSTLRRMGTFLRLPGPFWQYAGYVNRLGGKNRILSRKISFSPTLQK